MRYLLFLISLCVAPTVRAQLFYPLPAGENQHFYQAGSNQLTREGFTVAFSATLSDIKNNGTLVFIEDSVNEVVWRVGANEDGKVYITRYINTGVPYNWNVTFWNPESANYSFENETGRIFFMIIQESGELRIHVGTPDGKFDCMYLDYGLENTAVYTTSPHYLTFQQALSHIAYWKQPLCRTDAFSYAKEHFYDVSQPTWSSLIDHEDAVLRNTVHTDDEVRIGHCFTNADGSANTSDPGARTGSEVVMQAAGSVTSPEEDAFNQAYVVYPNPNSGQIHVRFAHGFTETEEVQVTLYDLQLRPGASGAFRLLPGENELVWDISGNVNNLSTGVYLLEIKSSHQVFRTRIAIDCACNAR